MTTNIMKTNELDIRWEQRFSNYRKALVKFTKAVEIVADNFDDIDDIDDFDDIDDVDELQYEGLIQRFEYTQELAWKVMKDYAKYQGIQDIKGSRDAFLYGFKNGIIDNEEWMSTIEARNRTAHTYNASTALEVLRNIIEIYHPLFLKFEEKMLELQVNNTTQTLL